MILHEHQNKQIIEEFVKNLGDTQLQNLIPWKRLSSIQLKAENKEGEFNFYAHKSFTIKGWIISPGFFEIVTGGLRLNLHLSDYPKLKDLAEKLIDEYFLQDLKEDNDEATKKLSEFTKSMSIEVFRDNRINNILENE
jgi:hypothetical protein